MKLLYVARNQTTGETRTFINYEELNSFAKENKYVFEYFVLPIVEEYLDSEIFLEDGEDPSDYL